MDLHVERQCLKKAKEGSKKDFFLLFDTNFDYLYKYIFRRIEDNTEARDILKLTFFDAVGQLNQFNEESSFLVWLYSLAKLRIDVYFEKADVTEAAKIRLDEVISVSDSNQESIKNINSMMNELTFEEREIVRLKLLENVNDGDVMTVLRTYDESIGTKIYKVLKRINALLFNNNSEASGVYFGKITGLFENIRSLESFFNMDGFKLLLKEDLRDRFDRKYMSIDISSTTINTEEETIKTIKTTNTKNNMTTQKPTGSNDPAKIFVEAVKEMREEEALNKIREERRQERQEAVYDVFDRFKALLLLIPLFIFVVIGAFVGVKLLLKNNESSRDNSGVITECNANVDINYNGEFTVAEKRMLTKTVANNACASFKDLDSISYEKIGDTTDKVKTELAFDDVIREYELVKLQDQFIITRYAKTTNSNV